MDDELGSVVTSYDRSNVQSPMTNHCTKLSAVFSITPLPNVRVQNPTRPLFPLWYGNAGYQAPPGGHGGRLPPAATGGEATGPGTRGDRGDPRGGRLVLDQAGGGRHSPGAEEENGGAQRAQTGRKNLTQGKSPAGGLSVFVCQTVGQSLGVRVQNPQPNKHLSPKAKQRNIGLSA